MKFTGNVKQLTLVRGWATSLCGAAPGSSLGAHGRMEGAIPRINYWSWSLSRSELDQRSRETRLRFERLERLLLPHTSQPIFGLLRLVCIIGVGMSRGAPPRSELGVGERSAAVTHAHSSKAQNLSIALLPIDARGCRIP